MSEDSGRATATATPPTWKLASVLQIERPSQVARGGGYVPRRWERGRKHATSAPSRTWGGGHASRAERAAAHVQQERSVALEERCRAQGHPHLGQATMLVPFSQ